MKERSMNPEMKRQLIEAARKLTWLYNLDMLANLLNPAVGFFSPEARDKAWEEAAENYSNFRDEIRELRRALKTADSIKKAGHGHELLSRLTDLWSDFLKTAGCVENASSEDSVDSVEKDSYKDRVVFLLTGLLLARIATSQELTTEEILKMKGKVLEMAESEVAAMASELGIAKGGEKIPNLSHVIARVLSGALKLTRQTQLEEK